MPIHRRRVSLPVVEGVGINQSGDNRPTTPGGKQRRPKPVKALLAVIVAVALVAVSALAVGPAQKELSCHRSSSSTLDPAIEPVKKVVHSMEPATKTVLELELLTFLVELFAPPTDPVRAPAVTIEKVALETTSGVALATFDDGEVLKRSIVAIAREKGKWQIESVTPGEAYVHPIAPDTFHYALMGQKNSYGGYVDPTATRVEFVDRCGAVVDRDTPVAGATLVLAPTDGLVRAVRDQEVLAAIPLVRSRAFGQSGPLNAASKQAGNEFTEALVYDGWRRAMKHWAGPDPATVIRPFGAILTDEYEITGEATRSESDANPRYFYPLRGPFGPATLILEMIAPGSGQPWQVSWIELVEGTTGGELDGLMGGGNKSTGSA